MELLQQWSTLIRDLPLLAAFLLGMWFADRRAQKRAAADAQSRAKQGERLGDVEKQVATIAALVASRSDAK